MLARRLGDWLDAYIAHTRVSEAPTQAHRWTGAWAIAGALRRNVWYKAGKFDWTPNFYIVLVGPPGVIQKSTSASAGTSLLERVPSVVFGPDSATWHGLLPRFVAAECEVRVGDRVVRCSPLSMAISELGSFLKLSQEGLDALLIDMWDGTVRSRPWTHTTQTHGDKQVWNGLLNLLGCTTLGWVRENIPASALETGLISRILFIYAEEKRELISIPKRDPRYDPAGERKREDDLLEDLCAIAALRGPMELTEDAYVWQDAWYRSLWAGARPEHLASERFDVYRSRKQSHLMKLAMALTASQGDTMTIGRPTLQRALKALDDAEHSVVRVFDTIGGPAEAQHTREVVGLVRALRKGVVAPKGVTTAEIFSRLRTTMTWDETCLALRAGVEAGLLRRAPGSPPGVLAVEKASG